MVSLTTSDNEQFTVDRDVAERSVLIKQMLEGKLCRYLTLLPVGGFLRQSNSAMDRCLTYVHASSPLLLTDIGDTDQPIPLPNVSSNVLKKVSSQLLS